MNKYSLFSLFFLLSYFSFSIQAVKPKVLTADSLEIERKALSAKGTYLGLKKSDSLRKFKADGCTFLYEKGIGEHPKNSKEFKFERFMISFSGIDKSGETSFDSVTYGASNYTNKYKPFDFSKSFPPRKISRVELPHGEGAGLIGAQRTELGKLVMNFKHDESYSTMNSSFFVKGELRKYKVEIIFSKFDATEIKLEKISVSAKRYVNGKTSKLVDVECNDFVKLESD